MTVWIGAALFMFALGVITPIMNIMNENDYEKSESIRKNIEKNKRTTISKEEWAAGKKKRIRTAIIVGVVFCLMGVVFLWIENGGLSLSSNSTPTQTSRECKSCHRTFTNSNEVSSIIRTGMCTNCYKNYKWGQEALGKE